MKVKVNRMKLIAALQYLAELKRGREVEEGYSIRETLRKYLSRALTMFNKGLKWPSKPKDEPPSYAHLLSKLELSEDKVLTVDDHSDYFRFVTREYEGLYRMPRLWRFEP